MDLETICYWCILNISKTNVTRCWHRWRMVLAEWMCLVRTRSSCFFCHLPHGSDYPNLPCDDNRIWKPYSWTEFLIHICCLYTPLPPWGGGELRHRNPSLLNYLVAAEVLKSKFQSSSLKWLFLGSLNSSGAMYPIQMSVWNVYFGELLVYIARDAVHINKLLKRLSAWIWTMRFHLKY